MEAFHVAFILMCFVISVTCKTYLDIDPGPVVTEDQNVTITCFSNSSTKYHIWDRNDASIIIIKFNNSACGVKEEDANTEQYRQTYQPECYVHDGSFVSMLAVSRKRVIRENGTTWSCFRIATLEILESSPKVTLSVKKSEVLKHVPVKEATIEYSKGAFSKHYTTQNKNMAFQCKTSACRPAARIEWFLDDVNVTDDEAFDVDSYDAVNCGLVESFGTLIVPMETSAGNYSVYCRAVNSEAEVNSSTINILNLTPLVNESSTEENFSKVKGKCSDYDNTDNVTRPNRTTMPSLNAIMKEFKSGVSNLYLGDTRFFCDQTNEIETIVARNSDFGNAPYIFCIQRKNETQINVSVGQPFIVEIKFMTSVTVTSSDVTWFKDNKPFTDYDDIYVALKSSILKCSLKNYDFITTLYIVNMKIGKVKANHRGNYGFNIYKEQRENISFELIPIAEHGKTNTRKIKQPFSSSFDQPRTSEVNSKTKEYANPGQGMTTIKIVIACLVSAVLALTVTLYIIRYMSSAKKPENRYQELDMTRSNMYERIVLPANHDYQQIY